MESKLQLLKVNVQFVTRFGPKGVVFIAHLFLDHCVNRIAHQLNAMVNDDWEGDMWCFIRWWRSLLITGRPQSANIVQLLITISIPSYYIF